MQILYQTRANSNISDTINYVVLVCYPGMHFNVIRSWQPSSATMGINYYVSYRSSPLLTLD